MSFGRCGIPRSEVIGLFASFNISSEGDGTKPRKSVISLLSKLRILMFGDMEMLEKFWIDLLEKTAWVPKVGEDWE
jgi:hypothetical protein